MIARVGRCQTVIVNDNVYAYGEKIPYLRWKMDDKGESENEIWDAEICAVSGMRENNIELVGKNENGDSIDVIIDMDDVISSEPIANKT